jgi:5'-methylthioadenosine phosphorylase
MKVGIISGTGGYNWPGLEGCESRQAHSRYGEALITEGEINGVEVVHLCRHGSGHARLSNQVDHRANMRALIDAGAGAVLSTTVCGAVVSDLRLGSLVVFDDIHFPSNRLPDGSLCTWHDTPGAAGRGHWIFDRPFSDGLRSALIESARGQDVEVAQTGCYGHVDGPRFNSRTEIAALATFGVCAVSQTVGPEVVLAGEAEVPIAVVGYLTDYANGVMPEPEPVSALTARIAEAPHVLAAVVRDALPRIGGASASGTLLRL